MKSPFGIWGCILDHVRDASESARCLPNRRRLSVNSAKNRILADCICEWNTSKCAVTRNIE